MTTMGSHLRSSVSLAADRRPDPASAAAKLVRCYSRNICAMGFEAGRLREAFGCGCVRTFVQGGDISSREARSRSTPSRQSPSNRSRLALPANAASPLSPICSRSRGMGEAKTFTWSTSLNDAGYGRIANARAGKPTPCSTFGQVTTMTAPAGGTLSRFAIASI